MDEDEKDLPEEEVESGDSAPVPEAEGEVPSDEEL